MTERTILEGYPDMMSGSEKPTPKDLPIARNWAEVELEAMKQLLEEREHMMKQITELQARGTELLLENRELKAKLEESEARADRHAERSRADRKALQDIEHKWHMEDVKVATACINNIAKHCYEIAKDKGWHEEPVPMSVACANIHGEVSELHEAYRNGALNHPCDKAAKMVELGGEPLSCLEEELADIVIRAFDTSVEFKADIGRAIFAKCFYNDRREYRHGGKVA